MSASSVANLLPVNHSCDRLCSPEKHPPGIEDISFSPMSSVFNDFRPPNTSWVMSLIELSYRMSLSSLESEPSDTAGKEAILLAPRLTSFIRLSSLQVAGVISVISFPLSSSTVMESKPWNIWSGTLLSLFLSNWRYLSLERELNTPSGIEVIWLFPSCRISREGKFLNKFASMLAMLFLSRNRFLSWLRPLKAPGSSVDILFLPKERVMHWEKFEKALVLISVIMFFLRLIRSTSRGMSRGTSVKPLLYPQ